MQRSATAAMPTADPSTSSSRSARLGLKPSRPSCSRATGRPIDEPGQMLLVKNDPNYHEQWPRALAPYKRIHGIKEPKKLAPLANDGKASKHLPAGTPFGLIGTSTLYKRESYPYGVVKP